MEDKGLSVEVMKLINETIDYVDDVDQYDGELVIVDIEFFLRAACRQGCINIIKLLIEDRVNINLRYESRHGERGESLLMLACLKGYLDIVKLLIEKGANVNVKDYDGHTVLMIASHKGYFDIVKLLIEKGADVNVISKDRESALTYAKDRNHLTVLEYLKEHGAIDQDEVIKSCIKDDLNFIELLIESNPDIHIKNTILLLISCYGELEKRKSRKEDLVLLLIEKGADVNCKDEFFGITPLMFASRHDRLHIAVTLIKLGADINIKDKHGNTALSLAKKHRNYQVIDLLKANGAVE